MKRKIVNRLVSIIASIAMLLTLLSIYPNTIIKAAVNGDVQQFINIAQEECSAGEYGDLNKYTQWYYNRDEADAWCHIFVSWCAEKAGISDLVPCTNSCDVGVIRFKEWKRWHDSISRGGDYIPQPGDIIYFQWENENRISHVGIVKNADDRNVYTIEGNNKYSIVGESTWSLNDDCIVGYGSPFSQGVNEGNDFYAAIAKSDTWSIIGTNKGNVEVVESTGEANCIWHFVRSNDGSYVIYNCEDNRVLDCYENYNEASVGVWDFYDGTTQHWWIRGKQNGEYSFVRNDSELVLDVTGGSERIGTNVQLYSYNESGAQLFSIYKVDKADSGSLHINPGNSSIPTKFTWDKGTNCTLYNLRINKGTPGNTVPYLDKWNLTDTFYSEVLPEGYYEAYVDFCNSFSATMGQLVQFYVSNPIAGVSNISVIASTCNIPTKFYWTKTENTTVYNLRLYSEQNGEMKPYQDIWNLTDTNYELELPVGKYEVYVNACNENNYSTSNKVQFTISGPIAGVSNISVIASTCNIPTKFNWTKTENTTVYNLRISSEQNGEMEPYQDIWNLTDTNYELELPVGKYEVYVNACNENNYSTSNKVQFTISEPIAEISHIYVTQGNESQPTRFNWTKANNVTVYNLRISSEQNGELKPYQDIWNLTDTSYELILPVGKYEVYVNACNEYNYSTSEKIVFENNESIVPKRPTVELLTNNQSDDITGIKWNPCDFADCYSIKIYRYDDQSGRIIKEETGIKNTDYFFNLDDGIYYATVTAENTTSCNTSTSEPIFFILNHDSVSSTSTINATTTTAKPTTTTTKATTTTAKPTTTTTKTTTTTAKPTITTTKATTTTAKPTTTTTKATATTAKPTTTTTKATTTTGKPTTTTTKATATTGKPTTTTTKATTTTGKPTTTTTKATTTTTKPTTTTTKATTTTGKPTTTTTKATTTTKPIITEEPITTTTESGTGDTLPSGIGDVNHDGVVDSSDASEVLMLYAQVSTGGEMTEEQKNTADINKDGLVDSSDASLILEYYAYVSTGGSDTADVFFSKLL